MKTIYALAYSDYDGECIHHILYTNQTMAAQKLIEINTTRGKYDPLYEIWEFTLDEN